PKGKAKSVAMIEEGKARAEECPFSSPPPEPSTFAACLRRHRTWALPTFEWVKINVQKSTTGARNPENSAIFRALDRVELESSAGKEDRRLQMLPIAETI